MKGDTPRMENRHVRTSIEDWQAACTRASEEGTTISAVVREFIVAYGKGKIPSRYGKGK